MTAAVLKFLRRNAAGNRRGDEPSPLYRHHEYCADCLGLHAIELTGLMAEYVRQIAPQTEGSWANECPELLEDCHPIPPQVLRENTLVLSGELLINLGESVETAFHALMACADRLRQDRAVEREVRRDAARAGEFMRLLFEYHLDEIERVYREMETEIPGGH